MEHIENDEKYKALNVQKGVENIPNVNPYSRKRAKRRDFSASEYVEGILKGDITVLGQAVTLIESTLSEHYALSQEIIEVILQRCLL